MSKIKATDIPRRPVQRWIHSALIAVPVVAILVVLLLLHPWNTSLGPGGLVAKAHAATAGLQSYRMISFTTYTYTSKGETSEVTWEIEFTAPDRNHGKVIINGDVVEVIIIGEKQYIRGPEQAGKVIAITESSFPTKKDTLKLLGLLTDLEKLPDDKIEGIDCLHYRGRFDVERIVEEQKAELDPTQPGYEKILEDLEQLRNMKSEIELWIGRNDYLIWQVRQDMQVPVMETAPERWDTADVMWKFYDFNKPITIEPPETPSGKLLPGWRRVDSFSTEFEPEEPP